MSVKILREEIKDWARSQGRHYHNTDLDLFFTHLESDDIALPSGTAEYVDMESNVGDGESLAIFSVVGNYYALRGTYSSWASEWDAGPYEVEKRTICVERWETLPDSDEAPVEEESSLTDELQAALERFKGLTEIPAKRDSNGRFVL